MRRIVLAVALLLQGPALAHHGAGHGRPVTATVYDSWYADRCDCNSIDLSAGAAWRLGIPLDGIATVLIRY